MNLNNIYWIGVRIRDRVQMKNGTITKYNLKNETTEIKFDDGEIRTLPHYRNPKENQPYGAFYTPRYHELKI